MYSVNASSIDQNHMLYGNFVGLQYVFSEALDIKTLKAALAHLIEQLPILTGQYQESHGSVKIGMFTPSLHIQNVGGHASEHMVFGTVQQKRTKFVKEPHRRAVLVGRDPLATFTLTQFQEGGCIFGMSISHLLVDAAGYHKIARYLADVYSAMQSGKTTPECKLTRDLDVFKFGSYRSRSDVLSELKNLGYKKPINFKTWSGRVFRGVIIHALDSPPRHARFAVHFKPEQLAGLKAKMLKESGEDWISTNMALGAHFTKLLATLSYGKTLKTHAKLGQLLDLRRGYFDQKSDQQAVFIGNAILIDSLPIHYPQGLQNASRGELTKQFKVMHNRLSAKYIKYRADLVADTLRQGFNYPGFDLKIPLMSVNNQSKIPVYDIAFGDLKPKRIIPQDVGDKIMVFPTPEGGVEIYIRDHDKPARQARLHDDEWQTQIFDF